MKVAKLKKAKKGVFPYFLDENKTEAHAINGAIVNWSHLPGYIKKAFYNTGNFNGKKFWRKIND